MKQSKTIKPITLEIEKDLWEKFKENTPRTTSLNNAIVCLITKDINENDNESHKNKTK